MQVPKYKPVKTFDARLVYDTWLRLVGDEELYDAMLDGRSAEAARARGMSDEEVLILEDFGGQPGTKWHMDNLRFRCCTMVSRILKWHLPATMMLLTGGNEDWLRDLTYEYMSDQRWRDLGHHRRFAECARFAKVVRAKLIKRRLTPPKHLDDVIRFELDVHDLLQKAALLAPEEWPKRAGASGDAKPRRSPATKLIEMPVDCVAWLDKPVGAMTIASEAPTTALVYVPAPSEAHKMIALDAKQRALFEACRGDKTIAELAGGAADARAALERWIADGVIAA